MVSQLGADAEDLLAPRRGVWIREIDLGAEPANEEIVQVLKEERDVRKACERLVGRALEREGPDNVTVVIVEAYS